MGKLKAFPTLAILLNIILEVLRRKRHKRYLNWNRGSKIICLQMSWIYMEKTNTQNSIFESSKILGCEINIMKKNQLYFFIPTAICLKKKWRKQSHLLTPKRIKYIETNSTEEVKDLCTENLKTLMRQRQKSMEEYLTFMDWKNTVKISILPKEI